MVQNNIKEIEVGKGLGDLKFGSSREQVLALLGEPTEKERYSLSDSDNDMTEAWHYDELDLSLSFDEENNWKLSSAALSSPDYTIDGKALIGMKQADVISFLISKGWNDIEEDEEVTMDNPENRLLHVDQASMSFWFENGELTEMQAGQYFNTDGVSN